VSAAADGEADAREQAAVDDHLVSCAECRSALETATQLRVPAAAAVDVDGGGFSPEDSEPGERRWLLARGARVALVVVGVLIVGFAVPEYFQGDTKDAAGHVGRHLATWQFGFGVGLVVAAVQSRFSQALLALATAVATLTIVTTVIDVAFGHRAPLAETVHVVELVGIVLLWWVTPPHLRPRRARRARRSSQPGLQLAPGIDSGSVPS